MSQRVILALDQGTTSSRAILFSRNGESLGQVSREFPQHYPAEAWVEHDPEDIWSTQLDAAISVIAENDVDPSDIVAIGITNQRETTVIWDRTTGKPLANAIVWQDRRTADVCDDLAASEWGDRIRGKTGLIVDPYFSATKIMWMLDRIEGARERAERGELAFGTIDSFLLWRLTGGKVHATDVSNASRTMMFNIHELDWDDEILSRLRIPRAMLPDVRESSGDFGATDSQWLGRAIPICGIAGDQQAASFGQLCFQPGTAKQTYGTGSFLLMNTGHDPSESDHGLLSTIAWKVNGLVTYALEGSIFVTGSAVQWLRDSLQIINDASETEAMAMAVRDTGGVTVVPALAGMGAPHWRSHARGAMFGLTRGTGRNEIVRATLESIAFLTRDVLTAMQEDTGIALSELKVDGGMVANDFLMQFQADIIDRPVMRPSVPETTALGAAYLAGLSAGFWDDERDLERNWQLERAFIPSMSLVERKRRGREWDRAVRAAIAWADDRI